MNERDAGRHRIDIGRQRQREQIGADREQHVVVFKHLARRRRESCHLTAEERMRRRIRRRVGHELGIDRRAEKLGELDQFLGGVALRHRVAGHDHRPLGARENVGRRLDRCAVAAGARRDACRCHQVDVGVGAQDVARQREKHRPGWRRERGLGRAMHEPRQIGEAVNFERPLHQGPCDHRQVGPQDRLGRGEALLVLAGRHQDRRARLLGVVEHTERIAEARRGVEVAHRELAGGLRVAVGHRHDRGFLQAEQITDLGLCRECIHQRQLGGAGIAEYELHALLLEELEKCFLSGHHRHGQPPYLRAQSCISTAGTKAGKG